MKRSVVVCTILFLFSFNIHGQDTWKNVPIGGGGYVTGIVIHPKEKDLMYIRTDVGGSYRWDYLNEKWIPLMEAFPDDQRSYYSNDGIAIDPNNPEIVYVAAGRNFQSGSDVLKSEDRGITWKHTNLKKIFNGNGDLRWTGECLIVDPNNSDILYAGTRYNGLWVCKNATQPAGSMQWTKVADLPDDVNGIGIRSIIFDKQIFSGSESQNIFVSAYGVGLYFSADAGTSWSLLPGSPTDINRMEVAKDTTLFVAHSNGLSKFKSNTWTDVTPDPTYITLNRCGLSIDPTNPKRLITSARRESFNCPIYISEDAGTTWTNLNNTASRHNTIPWWPSQYFSSATAQVIIDPHDTKKVWYTDWFGIWSSPDITQKPKQDWYNYEKGHEEMVGLSLCTTPAGANLFTAIADNDGMRHIDLNKYPLQKYGGPAIQSTISIDFCESDPNKMARTGSDNSGVNGKGGYSEDNGVSWTPFGSWPYKGAQIAVSSTNPELFVTLPIGDTPKRSTNKGLSWEETSGGPSNTFSTFWGQKHSLVSDRVNGNKFYLFDGLNSLYRSDDGGATWNVANQIGSSGNTIYDVKAAPGMEGEVWLTESNQLYRSSNSGNDFSKISNVQVAKLFCFGKPKDGSSTPTLFVYGTINNIPNGIFRSDDMGSTWARINDDNSIIGDNPNYMQGDRQVYGRVFISTGGRGVYYNEPNITTDIDQSFSEKTFQAFVYPNPVVDILNVNLPVRCKTSIEIFDLFGRRIQSSENFEDKNYTYNLSSLKEGIYFVKIVNLKENIIQVFSIKKL